MNTSESGQKQLDIWELLDYSSMNTEVSDILIRSPTAFPYYIVEKQAVSDAALVFAFLTRTGLNLRDVLVENAISKMLLE